MEPDKICLGKKHPREDASFASRLFFWYMVPLFMKGVRKDLQQEDLYDVPKRYEASLLLKVMVRKWKISNKRKFALLDLLWRCHGPYYVTICFAKFFFKSVIIFFQPFAYSKIIAYFVPGQTAISGLYVHILAVALIMAKFLYAVFEQNSSLWLSILGIKIKAGLYGLVYKKIMKIDYLKHPEMGRMITLLSKDLQTLSRFLLQGAYLLESIITTVMVSIILYLNIGIATLPAIFAIVFVLCMNGIIIYKMKQFEKRMCENAEIRYKILKESFQYMRLIKMYVWEKFFEKRISYYRRKEISALYKISFLTCFAFVMTKAILNASMYAILSYYMLLDQILTAEVIFFVLNSYRLLFNNFGVRMILAYTELGKLFACLKRIENTLNAAETNDLPLLESNSVLIEAKELRVCTTNKSIFENINFTITQPAMIILSGESSCGKTVLLKTLIGEYYTDGILKVSGKTSYASQEPWLFPGTIRQNILFGEKMDEERYRIVLETCALSCDFERMQDGDLTIVEDGGLNLSKGQCARINLARAVYRNADIYLIDDCFSSLNFEVRSEIFRECFCKFLKRKIVLIVTQDHSNLLPNDNIYTLQNNILVTSIATLPSDEQILAPSKPYFNIERENMQTKIGEEDTKLLRKSMKEEQIYKEENKKGRVKKGVYLKYFLWGGNYFHYGVLLLVASSQALLSYYDVLLSNWADFREKFINKLSRNDTRIGDYEKQANHKYIVCIILIGVVSFLGSIRHLMAWYLAKRAVINLHENALNILYFPITFFENCRIGNILNKFSKDFTVIDERLFEAWLGALTVYADIVHNVNLYLNLQTIPMLTGVFVMITYTQPSLLIFCGICLLCFATVQIIYLKTSRNLRRLDSLTRAPVIGYIKSTFEGITTIRASHKQRMLTEQFQKFQNIFTSTTYTLECASATFWFVLNQCSTVFTAIIMIKIFVFDEEGANTAGNVGFVLLQSSLLQSVLSMALLFASDIENMMTSVERILEYTEHRNESQQGIEFENQWPVAGNIAFKNISLKYGNTKSVILRNFNFSVESGEKILIVGGTGAGKSSIFSILFRLYDFEGIITIDGVDIKTLSLRYLRSHLSIVSQDTVLFSGSIRDNIDPGRQCSDEELWHIIKLLKLTKVVNTLDEIIDENDNQFSSGQKQMISIARAMVKKNKILLLDEPFSNMDALNIELVEDVLVKHFKECTVLLVSHTMPRVWKFDKQVKVQIEYCLET